MKHLYCLATAALLSAISETAASPRNADLMPASPSRTLSGSLSNAIDSSRIAALPAAKATRAGETAITDPAGTSAEFVREASSYFLMASSIYESSTEDFASKIVVDGNDIYLQCPVYTFSSDYDNNAYIKGTLDGDKAIFSFPQYIGNVSGIKLYVNRMKFVITNEAEEKGMYYLDTDNNTVTFTHGSDGSYTLEKSKSFSSSIDMPDFIIGITETEGEWTGYGEWNSVYTPNKDTAVTRPDGVTFDSCQFRFSIVANLTPMAGQELMVGIDGDKVYLSNISPDYPQACVVGTLDGDKATFPANQYLGINAEFKEKEYFWPFKYVYDVDPYFGDEGWHMHETTELVLNYDATSKTFTSQTDKEGFHLNLGDQERCYTDVFVDMTISPMPKEFIASAPEDPVIWTIWYYDPDQGINFTRLDFALSMFNVENQMMNLDNVYYNIYFGNDVFTLTPARFENLKEDITDIPYNFTDAPDYGGYQIKAYGIQHFLYFDNWPDVPVNTIGVQSLYKADDGTVYRSNIVRPDLSGVAENFAEASETTSVKYFNLAGACVEMPANGLFVKVITKADGSRSACKVLVK